MGQDTLERNMEETLRELDDESQLIRLNPHICQLCGRRTGETPDMSGMSLCEDCELGWYR